jgi:hypothetical protein
MDSGILRPFRSRQVRFAVFETKDMQCARSCAPLEMLATCDEPGKVGDLPDLLLSGADQLWRFSSCGVVHFIAPIG